MCVESSHNTIEISDSLLHLEPLSILLNKFCKEGLNPFIFSQLKERIGRAPPPYSVD